MRIQLPCAAASSTLLWKSSVRVNNGAHFNLQILDKEQQCNILGFKLYIYCITMSAVACRVEAAVSH